MDIRVNGNAALFTPKVTDNAPRSLEPAAGIARPDAVQAPTAAQKSNTASQKSAAAKPSADELKQAVENINKSLQSLSQGLEFSVDTESKHTVVKVIDHQTRELIRQIPSEQALQIAKTLDQLVGKLLNEKA
ncbi:MAG: flagellar protein FlaG [Rhodoferax sp.]|jgi:flagellar protein FlaG|nr:flagellar protein FlaG [Rhodoferax sp.]